MKCISENLTFFGVCETVQNHLLLVDIPADINECVSQQPCDSSADCNNTVGSFQCICRAGFQGNGFNCTGQYSNNMHAVTS